MSPARMSGSGRLGSFAELALQPAGTERQLGVARLEQEGIEAAAMLDRLLHRSVVLNLDGDSYRLRDHNARADTLRRATTGTRTPLR